MKVILAFIFCIASFKGQCRQNIYDSNAVKHEIDSINRLVDNAVVNKELNIMTRHFAEDFYFRHSTGLVDSKKSWIDNVMKPATSFVSRTHDSVTMELHKDIAIVKGTLSVHKMTDGTKTGYALTYFRVYVLRKNVWQLLSHNSINEWKLSTW
ncbi:MAG: nuclear transport factor 2 family protein [Ginsengibacter sp.]